MSQSPKGILFSYAWETQEICPICPRFVAEGRSCQLPPRNFMILLFPGRGGFPGKHIEIYSTCQPIDQAPSSSSPAPTISRSLNPWTPARFVCPPPAMNYWGESTICSFSALTAITKRGTVP